MSHPPTEELRQILSAPPTARSREQLRQLLATATDLSGAMAAVREEQWGSAYLGDIVAHYVAHPILTIDGLAELIAGAMNAIHTPDGRAVVRRLEGFAGSVPGAEHLLNVLRWYEDRSQPDLIAFGRWLEQERDADELWRVHKVFPMVPRLSLMILQRLVQLHPQDARIYPWLFSAVASRLDPENYVHERAEADRLYDQLRELNPADLTGPAAYLAVLDPVEDLARVLAVTGQMLATAPGNMTAISARAKALAVSGDLLAARTLIEAQMRDADARGELAGLLTEIDSLEASPLRSWP